MRFFHTALSVNSIPKSEKFFGELFGFTRKTQGERPALGVRFVMLEDAQGSIIELFEHNTPLPVRGDLMDFQQIGIKHIAFLVEDMETLIKRAEKLGAKVLWPPQVGVTVKKLAFIADPNNIPIELVEQ